MIRLINVSGGAACTHYIGRPTKRYFPRDLQLGNPFIIGSHGTREEVIKKYEEYVRARPELMERIKNIPVSAVLGCWCSPQPCHGDVIIKIWKELNGEQSTRRII